MLYRIIIIYYILSISDSRIKEMMSLLLKTQRSCYMLRSYNILSKKRNFTLCKPEFKCELIMRDKHVYLNLLTCRFGGGSAMEWGVVMGTERQSLWLCATTLQHRVMKHFLTIHGLSFQHDNARTHTAR
jgi:hypothetical protein